MESFTETTRRSWGGRLMGALAGVVVGLVLVVASMPLLWWNEGRSVDRAKALADGLERVVAVPADKVDTANEAGLVHLSARAIAGAPLVDGVFGLSADALKLRRVVEMYQWVEEKEERTVQETGGSERTETTYRYHRAWAEGAVDSGRFRIPEGHVNPAAPPYRTADFVAARITVGAFVLSAPFVSEIDRFQELAVTEAMVAAAPPDIRQRFRPVGGTLYSGDPSAPQVGDLRVGFRAIGPQEISAVGRQSGDLIEPYRTRTGEIALLQMGRAGAEAMFADARDENALLTWVLRLVGFVLMWLGLALVLGPFKILADVLPILGSLVGAGVAAVTGLVAFGVSFVTIGVAWLAYRPLVGGGLLLVAAVAAAGVIHLVRSRRRPAAAPST